MGTYRKDLGVRPFAVRSGFGVAHVAVGERSRVFLRVRHRMRSCVELADVEVGVVGKVLQRNVRIFG
jgi:hypothetical protein